MKITYVKNIKGEDPILQILKEILLKDEVLCADISSFVGTAFSSIKIRRILQKDHPGLLIGYGNSPDFLNADIPMILIDPVSGADELILDSDTDKLHLINTGVPTESLGADDLSKHLLPMIELLRDDIQSREERLEKLIDMGMRLTDASPDDFDGTDDITGNLKKNQDTACLADKVCPDCGCEMIRFYVCSPPWTWKQGCGRAGVLTYCPDCKTQHGFLRQFMN